MIDRVYGGLYSKELRQADGTSYKGKLYDKRRLIKRKSHHGETIKFYSRCTATADGRWFDNGGLPIEPPKEIEDDKQGSNPEDSKLD
jgi:hypothetical protein